MGQKLIDLQIEEILRTIMSDKTNVSVYDEAKAVLRDLGLSCDLKCPWTGAGSQLQHD